VCDAYMEAFRAKLHKSEVVSQRETAGPSAPPSLW
jgi:hypothetical protein